MTVESIGAAGYFLVSGALVLAQATELIPKLPEVELGSIASVGFAVWYGWYTTSKAIPRIIDQHVEQEKEKDASHERQIAALTAAFARELEATRNAREQDRERFVPCIARAPGQ